MISSFNTSGIALIAFMAGAGMASAQDAPVQSEGTVWSSYTVSEDCIKSSLTHVLADSTTIQPTQSAFVGASIDPQNASDINFSVHVFRDPEDVDYTVTGITHYFATNLSQDFRPEDGIPLVVRNGYLAYEPDEYEVGINLESRTLHDTSSQRISNGEFVENGYGPIEYDTEERVRYLDGLLRACGLTM